MRYNNVLVLNKSWIPIQIVEYKRSIAEVYTGKAHALDLEYVAYDYTDWIHMSIHDNHFKFVHTVDRRVCIPEIIVLTRSNRLPKRDIKYSRQSVFNRDKFKCQYCGKLFVRSELTIDHVYPKHLGGRSTWDNVVAACRPCNEKKGHKLLKDCGMKLIAAPKKPKWKSPTSNIHLTHYCDSWNHFLDRVNVSAS